MIWLVYNVLIFSPQSGNNTSVVLEQRHNFMGEKLMSRLEAEIAEYVGNYTRHHGYPPTVEELISAFGLITIFCVMFYVLNLYRIGMIRNSLFFGTKDLVLIPVKTE